MTNGAEGIRVGVTGSRNGLTNHQLDTMGSLLWTLHPVCLSREGDCKGVDAVFAAAVDALIEVSGHRTERHVHPANVPPELRAFTHGDVIHPTKHPIDRNRDMIDHIDVLLAFPDGPERRGSGTWFSINYGISVYRWTVVVMPDGTVTEYNKPRGDEPWFRNLKQITPPQ